MSLNHIKTLFAQFVLSRPDFRSYNGRTYLDLRDSYQAGYDAGMKAAFKELTQQKQEPRK